MNFLLLILALSTTAFAGPLEFLSQQSYRLSGGRKCGDFDLQKTQHAITRADCFMDNRPLVDFKDISKIAVAVRGDSEDQFFNLLAREQSHQLSCSSSMAGQISELEDGPGLENLLSQLELLRLAKTRRNQISQEIANDPRFLPRICPTSLELLEAEKAGMVEASYTKCKQLISVRSSIVLLEKSFPLAELEPISKFLDLAPRWAENRGQLVAELKKAYSKSKQQLAADRGTLQGVIDSKGGPGLDRKTRANLLADPRAIERVAQMAGNDPDFREFICSTDARYGKGAEALSNQLTGLSLVAGGLAGASARGLAAKGIELASAARSSGSISLATARGLQVAAFGLNFVNVWEKVSKECGATPKPTLVARSAGPQSTSLDCAEINLETVARDQCVASSLAAATGFLLAIPPADINKAKFLLSELKSGNINLPKVDLKTLLSANARKFRKEAIWGAPGLPLTAPVQLSRHLISEVGRNGPLHALKVPFKFMGERGGHVLAFATMGELGRRTGITDMQLLKETPEFIDRLGKEPYIFVNFHSDYMRSGSVYGFEKFYAHYPHTYFVDARSYDDALEKISEIQKKEGRKIYGLQFDDHGSPGSLKNFGVYGLRESGHQTKELMAKGAKIRLVACNPGAGELGEGFHHEIGRHLLPQGGEVYSPTVLGLATTMFHSKLSIPDSIAEPADKYFGILMRFPTVALRPLSGMPVSDWFPSEPVRKTVIPAK